MVIEMLKKLGGLTPGARANLVENFANFQPYCLAFRKINKLFRLFLAARPGMGAEQFDKVKVKLP